MYQHRHTNHGRRIQSHQHRVIVIVLVLLGPARPGMGRYIEDHVDIQIGI